MVEIKGEEDRDKNRTAAKFRDGRRHFDMLNYHLALRGEPWKFHFYFISPDDFTKFFDAVEHGKFKNWSSMLMQDLASVTPAWKGSGRGQTRVSK